MVRGIVMESIEERAKDFAKGRRYTLTAYEAYIAGATEQKTIDIENAKNAFNKTCGWLSTYPSCESWYNELFENFMKNMEE